MRSYLFALSGLFLSACSGLPSTIKDIPVEKVSVREASQNPDRYKGTSVRWSGLIIEVDTQENYTLVQVLSYPINYYDRPELTKPSDGRFVIKSSEFLDPAIYERLGVTDAADLSDKLAAIGIGSAPGVAFGTTCDDAIRFAYSCATPMVKEGAEALKKALSDPDVLHGRKSA